MKSALALLSLMLLIGCTTPPASKPDDVFQPPKTFKFPTP